MNEKIRKDFPFLKKGLIYFDNAASTQKPKVVIDAIKDFYENHYANIHRGIYKLSQEASEMYEKAHEKVAKLIGAKSNEIVFTKNTTEAINLLAYSLGIKRGDEIIISEMEHHSNIIPWMIKGLKIKYIPVKNGLLELDKIPITKRTKIISCVHISNFLGTLNPVKEIGKIAKENNLIFIIDGAQSVPHMPVNVKKIDCDFLAFSAHKMCGPTGVGVLYGKEEFLERMKPFMGGGDMIKYVNYDNFKVREIPWKFEAGTPNIVGGYAFGVAVDYLKKIGMNNIWMHERKLVKILLKGLAEIGAEIYGPKDLKNRGGLVSFNVKKIDAHTLAGILDEKKICVRSGHHCVMPMHEKIGIKSSVRVSFYLYNIKREVDYFINCLNEVVG